MAAAAAIAGSVRGRAPSQLGNSAASRPLAVSQSVRQSTSSAAGAALGIRDERGLLTVGHLASFQLPLPPCEAARSLDWAQRAAAPSPLRALSRPPLPPSSVSGTLLPLLPPSQARRRAGGCGERRAKGKLAATRTRRTRGCPPAPCCCPPTMAPDCCSGCRPLLRLLLLQLLGASALAGAAPLCPSSPPSVDSVQGLARSSSVVIEGKVLAHSVAEPAAGGRGGGEEATTSLLPPPPPPLLILPEQPTSTAAAAASRSSLSGTILSSPSAPSPPSPLPSLGSPSPAPISSAARVRVHQVWPVKSGGLQKDALLWVLLPERGSACGSRLKAENRYIFFMEPTATFSVNGTGSPSPPLFRASSPPLETGRNLKKEVSRALCTRGCGK